MPLKRVPEVVKSTEECMLLYGKHNNVIKWKKHMQTMGMFFTTNKRCQLLRLSYADYSSESESAESVDEDEDEVVDPDAPALLPEMIATLAAEKAARATAREASNGRRRIIAERAGAKFRGDDYIQRKKDLKARCTQ